MCLFYLAVIVMSAISTNVISTTAKSFMPITITTTPVILSTATSIMPNAVISISSSTAMSGMYVCCVHLL